MGATDGEVLKLERISHSYRKIEETFNLVFVAEGYSEELQSRFEGDVQEIMDQLAQTAPFKDRLAAFNFFRLPVASTQDGADRGPIAVRTYFDAEFPGTLPGSELPRQLLVVNEQLVLETVKAAFEGRFGSDASLPHKIIVLVNTIYDGGSGGSADGIAVTSRSFGIRTALHELGHTFGLVDEYPSDGGVGPNLADTLDLPWQAKVNTFLTPLPTVAALDGPAITFETIGAFVDPAFSPVRYRSQWLCRMRYCCHDAFCSVCADHIDGQLAPFLH
jgi:hypothetical protein